MINLGEEVVDIVTGFTGVAIARMEALFAVSKIEVQQRGLNGDERPFESIWLPEAQLERKKKTICVEDDGRIITDEELRSVNNEGV